MKKTRSARAIRLQHTMRWRLSLFVFIILTASGLLTFLSFALMFALFQKAPPIVAIMVNPIFLTLVLICFCSFIGTLLSGFLGKYYLSPLKQLIRATEEIKKGNFKVRVESESNSRSEMGELIESFNDMAHELDSIELFRNDFINNFSHEFKTPIVSIRGFAKELLYDELTPEQRREYVKIIAEESDRLSKLATNVLELSKLENQQIVTNKSSFHLDEQLRQSILLQEHVWTEKEIEIIPELDSIRFYGNEELLAHIWNNLIANAIKFTPACGTVQIRLTNAEDHVTVQISDTGIGMTEEVKSHIFEKFYQGDPSHHHNGDGIGLTMAQRAATLCGGSIRVESAPNMGTTFTVTLPKG